MNERIKELMAQARTSFNNTGSYFTQELLMEKFAELLVSEFQNILHDNRGEATGTLSYRVEEHFRS
jgi:hypothetical protein